MKQSGPAATPAPPVKTPLGRRIVIFVCAIAAVALLIMTAIGDRGFLEARRRRASYAGLQQEVEKMNAENAALLAQITALKKQPYVIEKLAREELGYARPGEVIYLFPPEPEPAPSKP